MATSYAGLKENVWTDAYSARLLCLTTMSSRLPSLHAALLGVERRAAPGGRDENLHGYAVQVTEVAEPMIKPSRNKGRFNQIFSIPVLRIFPLTGRGRAAMRAAAADISHGDTMKVHSI